MRDKARVYTYAIARKISPVVSTSVRTSFAITIKSQPKMALFSQA